MAALAVAMCLLRVAAAAAAAVTAAGGPNGKLEFAVRAPTRAGIFLG